MGLNSSDRKGQKGDTQEMSHNLTGKSNRAPERTTNTHPYEVAVYKIEGLMTRVQPTQVFQQLVALKLDTAPSLLTL